MSGRRVLVVVAHTDDEALGMGATLRRHADAGDDVAAIHLTDGVGARGEGAAEADSRSAAAEASAAALGFRWQAGGAFPDNALDTVPLLDLARFVEAAKAQVQPDLVYTHHGGDLNVDHRAAFAATLTAFRPQPGERCVEIRTFEVMSATEWSHPSLGAPFRPNLFIDAGPTWTAKVEALAAYADEMRPFPHSRSTEGLEALAVRRGADVGLAKAEAFEIIRRIER